MKIWLCWSHWGFAISVIKNRVFPLPSRIITFSWPQAFYLVSQRCQGAHYFFVIYPMLKCSLLIWCSRNYILSMLISVAKQSSSSGNWEKNIANSSKSGTKQCYWSRSLAMSMQSRWDDTLHITQLIKLVSLFTRGTVMYPLPYVEDFLVYICSQTSPADHGAYMCKNYDGIFRNFQCSVKIPWKCLSASTMRNNLSGNLVGIG